MKIAIMQPYVFPYLGYFQLVNEVDTFVFFDDVNYINKGWINRNQLLHNSKSIKFTIPLVKASQNRIINEIEISDFFKWRKEFLNMVEVNYRKAPNFEFVFNWLKDLLKKDYILISDLAEDSVKSIAALLQISTGFQNSSLLNYRNEGTNDGQQKIIHICKLLGAKQYINPQNGISLYDRDLFKLANIDLNFLRMNKVIYSQNNQETFVESLSIIDVLMFNSIAKIKSDLLPSYILE